MAIYLLNLGFSMQPAYLQTGAFMPYVASMSGLTQSCAWFLCNQNINPGNWGDVALPIPAINAANWTPYPAAGGNSDMNMPTFNGGDYLCVRIFQMDSNPGSLLVTNLRPSLVFGNGSATAASGPNGGNVTQSPLMIGSNARPVVDMDNMSPSSFPGPVTSESPGAGPTTWTYCLGQIHSDPADEYFSINVGASCWAPSNATTYAIFGRDPIIKVKGGT